MASVSTMTVRRVIEHIARAIRQRPTHALPEHLCFDEFKSVKSVDTAMSFIFCNTVSHRVIDIVEDRKQYALTQYVLRYDRAVRYQVKTITIDMYAPYINVIKVCFPNAKIIIDKFHLVQVCFASRKYIEMQWKMQRVATLYCPFNVISIMHDWVDSFHR